MYSGCSIVAGDGDSLPQLMYPAEVEATGLVPWARSEARFLHTVDVSNRAGAPIDIDENELCRDFDSEVLTL